MEGSGKKLQALGEAAALVPDGALLALGGFTLYRRPVAFCRSLVEREVRDLEVVAFTAGYETELLVEGGCVRRLRCCYAGLEHFGPAPLIRAAAERGELEFVDESELSIAIGLQAAVLDVPWIPVRHALAGTDLPETRPDFVEVDDPTTGETLLGLPALRPQVAVIHAAYADEAGNAILGSSLTLDRELTFASELVVVTADAIVDPADLAAHGDLDLIAPQVDVVVHAPGGSRPCSCLPHYRYDPASLLTHMEQR